MSSHLWQGMGNRWNGTWDGRVPKGDQHSRSRDVVLPTGAIVRGKFPSRKNGRMVQHEGLLELDSMYLFETSPRIVRYREQLERIHYADGAKLRRYTPDFELVLSTGEIIVIEIKPTRSLVKDEVRRKIECISNHYDRVGETFLVLTEESLRQEPRQSNLRWLYHRTPRVPLTPNAIHLALEHVRDHFPLSIRGASTLLAQRAVDPYSALLAGFLRCDLHTPISLDTTLYLKEQDDAWFLIAQKYGF